MAETTYTYNLATDFPNGVINTGKFDDEIRTSAITTALEGINVVGDVIDVVFKDSLSVDDKTILDNDATGPSGGLIVAHDNTPYPDVSEVNIANIATMDIPTNSAQRVAIQPGRTGFYMCDRDIRLNTAMMTNSFEDLKINCSTNVEEDWGEFSLVGVYKDDGSGGRTGCADQADADSNALLSVYDYLANDQAETPTPLDIDLKGGCFWVDPALSGDVWKHRMYAVLAPNIPATSGGRISFFDGYLEPYKEKWMDAINTIALSLNPTVSSEAARTRFWVFYPEGVKQTHVLRLVTYRQAGTF